MKPPELDPASVIVGLPEFAVPVIDAPPRVKFEFPPDDAPPLRVTLTAPP